MTPTIPTTSLFLQIIDKYWRKLLGQKKKRKKTSTVQNEMTVFLVGVVDL